MTRLASSVPEAVRFSRTWAFEIFRNFENPLLVERQRVKTNFMLKLFFVWAAVAAVGATGGAVGAAPAAAGTVADGSSLLGQQ